VEGKVPVRRITLQPRAQPSAAESTEEPAADGVVAAPQQAAVIPSAAEESLIGDLLSLDLPSTSYNAPPPAAGDGLGDLDLLGDLSGLQIGGGMGGGMIGAQPSVGGIFGGSQMAPVGGGLDLFGGLGGLGGPAQNPGIMFQGGPLALPKQEWLPAFNGKGMEITGTFVCRGGQIFADMTFTNKALQGIGDFAIQFNKNSFGLSPAGPLTLSPLMPNTSASTLLPIKPGGQVMKMNPLAQLQVAVKNNVDVFYFTVNVHTHVLFAVDGTMDRKVFLATWKEIPPSNEVQGTVDNVSLSADQIQQKLESNNVFLIARRQVDVGGVNQDLMYMSLKFINNIWVLVEVKVAPGATTVGLALKTSALDVIPGVLEAFKSILHA
jgi:hypothetical protein